MPFFFNIRLRSCVEKCQPQNTHVLRLKSSFFFQTKEKLFAFFFGQISVLTFQHNFWFICGLCVLFFIFCPTDLKQELYLLWKQCWINLSFWKTLTIWSQRPNNTLKLTCGQLNTLGKAGILRASTIFYSWESWKGDQNLNRFAGPEITRQLILGCFQPAVHRIMWQLLDKPAWCCQTALPSHCLEIWLIWKKKYKWPSHLCIKYWADGKIQMTALILRKWSTKMWLRKRNNFWHWQWCRCLFVRML